MISDRRSLTYLHTFLIYTRWWNLYLRRSLTMSAVKGFDNCATEQGRKKKSIWEIHTHLPMP